MSNRDDLVRNLLWKEVANKSPPASGAFGVFAIIIFFYHFHLIEFKIYVQIAAVVVFFANILRFSWSKKISLSDKPSSRDILFLKLFIWINAFAWGTIFSLGSWELNSESFHFSVMLAILVGFQAASILTLGYDKSIFLVFMSFNLLPVTFITFFQYYSGANPNSIYLVFFLFILFFYLLKQYKDYREQLLERYGYQLDLERAFKEIKKSQEAFIQETAKLLHTSKISALSEMAGGLAHEVNNSLQIILGSGQQIQRELTKQKLESTYINEKFKVIDKSIHKISEVITGLKYFSQEMDHPKKEIIPLKTIIDRSLSYTFEMLKAHQVDIKIGEIPDLDVYAHQFQITQILFNLFKNADDAMTKNEVKILQVNFLEKDGFVFIRIIDNGRGISTENQTRLFQPFFSTKDINLGTGLSLSISRGLALEHEGDLFYDSYEKNTTFVLKLPIRS